jgi:hypothetical protein
VAQQKTGENTNVDRLKEAGIIRDETGIDANYLEIIQSLTSEEVTQLIALRDRLGVDFVEEFAKPSASFLF